MVTSNEAKDGVKDEGLVDVETPEQREKPIDRVQTSTPRTIARHLMNILL